MFAVNVFEPLNAVEFTVTPPGFVVPVTNHWALAPFLKPLPLIVTFKLVVPWGAAEGLVEVTCIWPAAGNAPIAATTIKMASSNDEQRLDFISTPQEKNGSALHHPKNFFLSTYTDNGFNFPQLIY
jgi:hypothetical protein